MLPLPDGEVGVLRVQVGHLADPPTGQRVIEGCQLVPEYSHGPPVRHDVVHANDEQMVGGIQPEHPGPEERPPGQVEGV